MRLFYFTTITTLQKQHQAWVERELTHGVLERDARWSESIAVGSESFIDQVKNLLDVKGYHRKKVENEFFLIGPILMAKWIF